MPGKRERTRGMRDYQLYREEEVGAPLDGPLSLARGVLLRAVGWSLLLSVPVSATIYALSIILIAGPRWISMSIIFWLIGMMPFGPNSWTTAGFLAGLANGLTLTIAVLASGWLRVPARRRRWLLSAVGMTTTLALLWTLWLGTRASHLAAIMSSDIGSTSYEARAIINFLAETLVVAVAGWWVGDRVERWHASAADPEDGF